MPITDIAQLKPDSLYSYADYLRWQFREAVELVRGRIVRMSPAPSLRHQRCSMAMSRIMANFFHPLPCEVFAAPFDVRLPSSEGAKPEDILTTVQPDLCVVCDPAKLDERGCLGAPDWVIEILSPGNSAHELRTKFELYEQAGVREYWIVDPEHEFIDQFAPDAQGRYQLRQRFIGDDRAASALFPDLAFDLDEVFARDKT